MGGIRVPGWLLINMMREARFKSLKTARKPLPPLQAVQLGRGFWFAHQSYYRQVHITKHATLVNETHMIQGWSYDTRENQTLPNTPLKILLVFWVLQQRRAHTYLLLTCVDKKAHVLETQLQRYPRQTPLPP